MGKNQQKVSADMTFTDVANFGTISIPDTMIGQSLLETIKFDSMI